MNSDCGDLGPHPASHTVTSVSSTSVQRGGGPAEGRAGEAGLEGPRQAPPVLSGTSSPSRGSLTGRVENVPGRSPPPGSPSLQDASAPRGPRGRLCSCPQVHPGRHGEPPPRPAAACRGWSATEAGRAGGGTEKGTATLREHTLFVKVPGKERDPIRDSMGKHNLEPNERKTPNHTVHFSRLQ